MHRLHLAGARTLCSAELVAYFGTQQLLWRVRARFFGLLLLTLRSRNDNLPSCNSIAATSRIGDRSTGVYHQVINTELANMSISHQRPTPPSPKRSFILINRARNSFPRPLLSSTCMGLLFPFLGICLRRRIHQYMPKTGACAGMNVLSAQPLGQMSSCENRTPCAVHASRSA